MRRLTAELVSATSLSFIARLIRWAIKPFRDLYTDAPALIFLSSSTYSRMKLRRILSFNRDAFKADDSPSVKATSIILIISLWRRLLRGYYLKRFNKIGKNFSVLATMSLVLITFSLRMNLMISIIFILPVPSLGLLLLDTVSFSQLFSIKC